MNQCQKIIKHIDRHGYITSYDAFRFCQTTSLHRRLSDLRELGYEFKAIRVDGEKTQWNEYHIIKRPKKKRDKL
jgi:hypothetical protein